MSGSFQPQTWQAPPNRKLRHPYGANNKLKQAVRWGVDGRGPEDVIVDENGWIYSGLSDGRIVRLSPDGMSIQTIADTGGRPLGLEWMGTDLLVCDARQGLLAVSRTGQITTLIKEIGEVPLRFANNATVGSDGTIYFSISSQRWGIEATQTDLLEHSCTGRLLRYSPSGQVDVLWEELCFPNGVTWHPHGDSLLLAELGSYRIHRLWLSGPRQGAREVWVENLPGFPDNLNTFDRWVWCAFPSKRNQILDASSDRPQWRHWLHRAPQWTQRLSRPYSFVVAYDTKGKVVANLGTRNQHIRMITCAYQTTQTLYLGSLVDPWIGVYSIGGNNTNG